MGFGLHEPPKMRKAMTKNSGDGSKTPVGGSSGYSPPDHVDTSGGEPMEGIQSSSSIPNINGSTSAAPRGLLNVKLISARGLAVSNASSADPQPYVVIQFEQNEFVSRPPHPVSSPASVPFTTSTAQPVTPGITRTTSGLGIGTISRAFAEAVGRGKGKREEIATPRAEEPKNGGSWLGRPGPGDPIWKEEVSL